MTSSRSSPAAPSPPPPGSGSNAGRSGASEEGPASRSGNAETFTAFEWFYQNHALRIREDEGVTTFDEAVALLRKAWDSMSPVMKRPYVLQAECDRKIVKQQRHNQRKALKRERAVPQPVQVLESEEPAQAVASVCGLVDLPSTDLHNPDSWGTADGEGSWTVGCLGDFCLVSNGASHLSCSVA